MWRRPWVWCRWTCPRTWSWGGRRRERQSGPTRRGKHWQVGDGSPAHRRYGYPGPACNHTHTHTHTPASATATRTSNGRDRYVVIIRPHLCSQMIQIPRSGLQKTASHDTIAITLTLMQFHSSYTGQKVIYILPEQIDNETERHLLTQIHLQNSQ